HSFGDFISFPIFQHPEQIFGLLMGKDATLIAIDLPPLDFKFSYTQFFPIFGPLGVSITGSLGALIDFGPIGYDTHGRREFFDSGFRNPELLFDGLFISDTAAADGSGPDVPEVTLTGGISAAAELNLGIARAGVAGGIFAEIDFNLHDPNKDGKLRLDVLQLNMGKFANLRLEGDTRDIAENFKVTQADADHVNVTAFGFTQKYKATSKIIALGGEGDDVIDLSGITNSALTYDIDGGAGNDTITLAANAGAAVIRGGSGDDHIVSGAGNDIIYGEAGNDFIDAGAGNDLVFADDGKIGEDGR